LDVNPEKPYTFSNEKDLTGHFSALPEGSSHTVQVNEATNYIFAAGVNPRNSTCKAGLYFIDMSDPSNPTSTGCASEEGYVHDAQCVVYNGPHTEYIGHEICVGKYSD
jgi:hypothetical protein